MWARSIVLGSDSFKKRLRKLGAQWASINMPFVALLQLGYRRLVIRNGRLGWSSITRAQLRQRVTVSARTET